MSPKLNQLDQFLADCTAPEPDARIRTLILHEVFLRWCEAGGHGPWFMRAFSKAMDAAGYERVCEGNRFFWVGLRLEDGVSQ